MFWKLFTARHSEESDRRYHEAIKFQLASRPLSSKDVEAVYTPKEFVASCLTANKSQDQKDR
jgi:hypothetical protein